MRRLDLVLVGVVLWAGCGGASEMPASAPNASLGQTAGFSLPSDTGALVSIPIAGAKATVVDAFGPTCEPCRKKVPALVAQRSALGQQGVSLVLVAVLADGEETKDASAALSSWGASSGFLVDRGDRLAKGLDIRSLPGTVILDRTGKVRWAAAPTSSTQDVVAAARAIAAEAP